MSETHQQRISSFLQRVLTEGKVDATGDYFHDDVIEEVPFPGQEPGLAGLMDTVKMLRSAFPDMAWRVEEQLAEEARVMTRFIWTGTHAGEFLGIPATHRTVEVWGIVIDHFDGDKVKSTRILMDTLGLIQQLGAKC